MDARGSRLLGDGSFGHPGQLLKWMDLRVSPILYTLFDQCDIQNLSDCAEIDGWDSFVQFAKLRAVFLFTNGKKCHGCSLELSPWRQFFLGSKDNCYIRWILWFLQYYAH